MPIAQNVVPAALWDAQVGLSKSIVQVLGQYQSKSMNRDQLPFWVKLDETFSDHWERLSETLQLLHRLPDHLNLVLMLLDLLLRLGNKFVSSCDVYAEELSNQTSHTGLTDAKLSRNLTVRHSFFKFEMLYLTQMAGKSSGVLALRSGLRHRDHDLNHLVWDLVLALLLLPSPICHCVLLHLLEVLHHSL